MKTLSGVLVAAALVVPSLFGVPLQGSIVKGIAGGLFAGGLLVAPTVGVVGGSDTTHAQMVKGAAIGGGSLYLLSYADKGLGSFADSLSPAVKQRMIMGVVRSRMGMVGAVTGMAAVVLYRGARNRL